MEESKYSQYVLDRFDHYFSKEWIDELRKSDDIRMYRTLIDRIELFWQDIISQYGQLVLSGDHLIHDVQSIDTLLSRIDNVLNDEFEDDSKVAQRINNTIIEFLRELHIATRLVKYHVEITRRYFTENAGTYAFEGIAYKREVDSEKKELVEVLDLICDVCADEYRFSYDEKYIRRLIIHHTRLTSLDISKYASTIWNVINATIEKVEFLLSKLSLYAKDKAIVYNIDFQTHTITLGEEDKNSDDNEFRRYCRYFYNPKLIPEQLAIQWLEDVGKKDTEMWKIVYLMRYYCKHTHSIQQIDNLIKIGERHYNEYINEDTRNIINNRAAKFFINYMYNSRFSFLCQHDSSYSYEDMKKDLAQIRMVQENTGIHNYHPYQKACQYLINYIKGKLNDLSYSESLREEWNELNAYYRKLKENAQWCVYNQPYLMQFRFKFSTMETEQSKIAVYFPSSVSRPLKFEEIWNSVSEIGNAVQWLDLQIDHQVEKRELMDAKDQLGKMEDSNLKHMGYFITVTTFLVGLLAIFIGNTGGVSIFEKMEYVVALGVILLLFVSVGYIAVTDQKDKLKYWILMLLAFAGAGFLGWVAHMGYEKHYGKIDCPLSLVSEAIVEEEEPLEVGTLINDMAQLISGDTIAQDAESYPSKQEVRERLMCFKQMIENNDGYKLLNFNGKKIAKEEDLQLLFRFVWNGTQLSVDREVNNGRGPVDYKFSNGADDATLVEFKLASNTTLKQNLQHQVEIYKAANQTESALIPIIYFTVDQYNRVQQILRELNMDDNEDIILIDATDKLSASNMK